MQARASRLWNMQCCSGPNIISRIMRLYELKNTPQQDMCTTCLVPGGRGPKRQVIMLANI